MKIGARIAATRKSKGLSQDYIAKKLGKTPQWLSNIERSCRPISAEELVKVAGIIGVDPAIFFADDFHELLNNISKVPSKSTA